jgi:hypothetical protein
VKRMVSVEYVPPPVTMATGDDERVGELVAPFVAMFAQMFESCDV